MSRATNSRAKAAPAASAASESSAGTPGPSADRAVSGQARASGDDRDSWCTPSWLTALLPAVDLDPCSNRLSTVHAARTYRLERGQDGLVLPWQGSLFVNPPFSDIRPWASKLDGWRNSGNVTSAAFLVNVDPSTAWWAMLTRTLGYGLFFSRRIQFTPPPGVKPSTNSKAQVLLMDSAFLAVCDAKLLAHGSVWAVVRERGAHSAEESSHE